MLYLVNANGRDSYGRLICVTYLTVVYGQPKVAPNFNRLLVDSGHARLENFTNNEFDPQDWPSGQGPQAESKPLQGLGQDLKQNLQEDLLPKPQESAGKDLDKAAKEGWDWLKVRGKSRPPYCPSMPISKVISRICCKGFTPVVLF
jgi:hypothetical protein